MPLCCVLRKEAEQVSSWLWSRKAETLSWVAAGPLWFPAFPSSGQRLFQPQLLGQGPVTWGCSAPSVTETVCRVFARGVRSSSWYNLLPPDGSTFVCSIEPQLSASPNASPKNVWRLHTHLQLVMQQGQRNILFAGANRTPELPSSCWFACNCFQ